MATPQPGLGSWEFSATRHGDRVQLEVTAASDGGDPVTLVLEVSREEARRIAALVEAAAGDAFRRRG